MVAKIFSKRRRGVRNAALERSWRSQTSRGGSWGRWRCQLSAWRRRRRQQICGSDLPSTTESCPKGDSKSRSYARAECHAIESGRADAVPTLLPRRDARNVESAKSTSCCWVKEFFESNASRSTPRHAA